MMKPYQIQVFGKAGCEKCAILNQRLDKLLDSDFGETFEKAYFDVETEVGVVAFASSECLNPQRIPALLLARYDEDAKRYVPVANPRPGESDAVYKNTKLYQYLGLQTDYSGPGGGVLAPKMIMACLNEALALAPVVAG